MLVLRTPAYTSSWKLCTRSDDVEEAAIGEPLLKRPQTQDEDLSLRHVYSGHVR